MPKREVTLYRIDITEDTFKELLKAGFEVSFENDIRETTGLHMMYRTFEKTGTGIFTIRKGATL